MSTQGKPAVRAKMEIPWFTAGKSKPSIWSAADMNVLVALCRAYANPTIERGDTDKVLLADGNVKIVIAKNGATAGGGLGMFHLKSVQGDYVTLRTWDGAAEGAADVFAAKEYKLRNSLIVEVVAGDTHEYLYDSGPDSNNVTRWDVVGSGYEPQIVVPPWAADEVVYAIPGVTGVLVGGADVGRLLIRTGAWARSIPLEPA